MQGLAVILSIAFLILLFICMKKEKQLIGIYKATNTFGRIYAFFAVDLLVGGIGAPIAQIVIALISEEETSIPSLLRLIAMGLVMAAIGVLMYVIAYKRCPDALKPRLWKDLTIIGLGVIIRTSLFFMMFIIRTWWEFSKPTEYVLDDGTKVYAYNDGTVYDGHGRKGHKDGNTVIWDN